MAISKEDNSLVKVDDQKNRFNPIAPKRITFAHQIVQSQIGSSVAVINLQALNTPSEMSALGFTQATQAEINGARLGLTKKNLRLSSSLKGSLIPNKHFIVVDNYTINLIGDMATALEIGEIIFGEIDSQQGDLIPASVKSRVKTLSVPVGQRTANLGLEYNVGSNSTERVGDIQVKVRNGSVLYRNSGNSSTILDGDYYEVDSGNGVGTTIMLNSPPSYYPLELVVDYGVNTITNNDSLGTLQSMMGSVIKIARDLSIVMGGSQNDYLTANPSDIERRTFGDMVLDSTKNVTSLLARVLKLETDKILYVSYFSVGGQNLPTATTTVINFESKNVDGDPLNCVTIGAGWNFKCPVGYGGKFIVTVTVTALSSTNGMRELYLFKTGFASIVLDGSAGYSSTGAGNVLSGSKVTTLADGEIFQIGYYQNSGVALSTAPGSNNNVHISIARIGN